MLISTDEMGLLIRRIRDSLATQIFPRLETSEERDTADHIDRLLVMLAVTLERSVDIEAHYRAGLEREDTDTDGGAIQKCFDIARTRAELEKQIGSKWARGSSAPPEISPLVERVVSLEVETLGSVAQSRSAIHDAPPYGGQKDSGSSSSESAPQLSPARLDAYLRDRLEGAQEAKVAAVVPISGGRSKQTLLVEMDDPGNLPKRFILRKDRAKAIVDSTTADEFDILDIIAAEQTIPVPRPLWVERDPERLGGTAMAVSLLPGSLAGEYHLDVRKPEANHRHIAAQMATILAHIHAIPIDKFARTSLDIVPDLSARIHKRIDTIAEQFDSAEGQPSVLAVIADRWLREHFDWGLLASPTLIHGDFGLHNLLLEQDTITGVLDWEFASIASPANDVAMCHRLTQYLDVTWEDFVDAYLEAGGSAFACDPRAVAFYRVLGLESGTVRSRYAGHLFRTGQRTDMMAANSGYDYHFRSSRLLADALQNALALQPLAHQLNEERSRAL